MASPSAGDLETQLKNAVDVLQSSLVGLASTAATKVDTYQDSIESDFATAQSASASSFRSACSSALDHAASMLAPILVGYNHHIVNAPETDVQGALTRIYDYFITNSKTIKSRGITFNDPVAAGTNTGTGAIYRLTKDEENYDREAVNLEVKTIECTADAHSGALKHEEIFEIRGQSAPIDSLVSGGSGIKTAGYKARTSSSSILKNSTFSKHSGVTAPTAGSPQTFGSSDTLTSWSMSAGAITSLQLDIDTVARDTVGDATPTALRFLGNCGITQTFDTANLRLDSGSPYYLEVWLYREGNATGTLTLTCGSKTQDFTIGSLTNAAWNRCRLSLDRDLWPARFNTANAAITFAITSLATSTILLDEICFVPFYAIDGTFCHISPSATTGSGDWLIEDSFTITDALAGSDSKIQQFLWRAFGRYLPHAASPTITDPS